MARKKKGMGFAHSLFLWQRQLVYMLLYAILPVIQNAVTIRPAIKIPATIAGRAYLIRILNRDAAIAPVHIPVIGRGIDTKSTSPKASYFSMSFAFLRVRAKSQMKNLSMMGSFLKKSDTGLKRSKSGKAGRKFPMTARKNALEGEIPSANATGIPPRSSATGNIETMIVVNSGGRFFSEATICSSM